MYCIGRVTRQQVIETFHKPIKARIFCRRWLWAPGSTIYDYPIFATLLGGYKGYDCVFEAIGPVIHLSRSRTPALTYVFFPPHPDLMGDGKFRTGFWRLYSVPYRIFYAMFSENIHSTRILSISEYVAGLCKRVWAVDSEVVYFPVPYEEWVPSSPHKRDGMITIGRFSPEKDQAAQIRIAEALRQFGISAPVNIIGAVSSPLNLSLYQALRDDVKARKIAGVNFCPNLSRGEVISLAQSSKVFLHTMRNEHFGIATVEAIAAGCIPIVHDSGGSREIVPYEELRFRTEAEAAEKVRLALNGEFDAHLSELQAHISKFSEETFKRKVTDIIISEAVSR